MFTGSIHFGSLGPTIGGRALETRSERSGHAGP